MRSMYEIEFLVRAELNRMRRVSHGKSRLSRKYEYIKEWAWETLLEYVKEHRDDDPMFVLERFMKTMEDWQIEATHEDTKEAFCFAHDIAENLYDTLVP